MSKNVQVAVRIRPLVDSELSRGCKNIIDAYPDVEQIRVRTNDKAFTYNYVFGPDTDQKDLYDRAVRSLVEELFKGYNVTVLAYGQTGSGKTHSMGTAYDGEGDMGVLPRAVADIFSKIQDNFVYNFTISVSFVELYQETLFDLLAEKPRDACVLDIREDPNKGTVIPGVVELLVNKSEDVFKYLAKGAKSRATSATNMNAQSSRSHAIFTVNIIMEHKTEPNENKMAHFHLVDLAGSERPKKTGAVGTTFKEGVNINKGLLVLGNVISALGDGSSYINYRDSNLTRLLKDSLGGNSLTLMIACISPADYNLDETLSTLRYADRARKIQNKPIINQDPKSAEINELNRIINTLRLQIAEQGGPTVCPAETELLRAEIVQLKAKVQTLTVKLSAALNDNAISLERMMMLQTANENLRKKIEELSKEYNVTLNNISTGLEKNDMTIIKDNLSRMQKIGGDIKIIGDEQKQMEEDLQKHEKNASFNLDENALNEAEINDKCEDHNNRCMALNTELQQISKNLVVKEMLAEQLSRNACIMVDYKAMAENEERIVVLQKEKDELLKKLKAAQNKKTTEKVTEMRSRVQELESQLQTLNKELQNKARLIKLKEKEEQKINTLKNEIQQMKRQKVKLVRTMREENETFRKWKIEREKELMRLKSEDRKKENRIIKMENIHAKQQNVLKRKVEESAAMIKRLKDALTLRKAAQDTKNTGKLERIGNWIKHELAVFVNLQEAKTALDNLFEDRANMQKQLDDLNSNPSANCDKIKNLKEEIDLRSLQIQELNQKLIDSEDDGKDKTRFDNIQTMGDAKFALKTVFDAVADIKRNEISLQEKLNDLQTTNTNLQQLMDQNNTEIKSMREQHSEFVHNLQKEYTEKTSILLQQLRGIEVKCNDIELVKRCKLQLDHIEELEKAQEEQKLTIENLEIQNKKLNEKLMLINVKNLTQNGELNQTFNNEKEETKTPTILRPKKDDTTIPMESPNIDVDNVERDPDWRHTPIGKWIERNRRTEKIPFKRTSDGGCMCTRNCTKRCGCRKHKKFCNESCKCLSHICLNRTKENDEPAENVSSTNSTIDDEFKKPRLC